MKTDDQRATFKPRPQVWLECELVLQTYRTFDGFISTSLYFTEELSDAMIRDYFGHILRRLLGTKVWTLKACPHWQQKSPKTETKSIRFRQQMATFVTRNGYLLSPFSATFVARCGQALRASSAFTCTDLGWVWSAPCSFCWFLLNNASDHRANGLLTLTLTWTFVRYSPLAR